eukprot:TRINITY_DN18121_c0_g1_i1.p1 TRINITY_DN18121_c0_g1~~TRINITY_DN18121_c0_g1_i1.p1  ORF type:complete len:280 (+),score=51.36 TRINITY_DN18121_c0_g1_i1:133-972(+)
MCIRDRFRIGVVVPFVTGFLLNQSCHAKWLRFWRPCTDSQNFDYTAKMPTFPPIYFPVTRHEEICTPEYNSGQCPRAMVDILGTLLFDKLIFGTFAGPCLIVTSVVVKSWWARCRGSTRKVPLDVEVAGVVMMMELVLIMGFCVPFVVPLAAACFGTHSVVFNLIQVHLDVELENHFKPVLGYLWGSLLFGWSFLLWFYLEVGLHGGWLVGLTPVLWLAVSVFHTRVYRRFGALTDPALVDMQKPLLDSGSDSEIKLDPKLDSEPDCDSETNGMTLLKL